jgi:glucose/arabinose dehydrogenase
MRPVVLAAGVAVAVLIVAGVVGVLAASDDLPWQSRVPELASDGTANAPTAGTGGSGTATPAGGSTTTPGTPSAHFSEAFPKLPELDQPTNMIEVPGERILLLTEQDGHVVSFAKDANASSVDTVLDWSAKTSRAGNEEGLLGLALDPAFAENHYVYLYYSAKGGDRRTVLSRFTTSGSGASLKADPGSELILLTVPQPFSNHKGGQLSFGPDGMLYLGLGDGGSGGDPNGNGQDLKKNLLGSIIRSDVRTASKEKPYAIPSDNPFASSPNGEKPETWAYGLRNPWRFSWDSATGKMFAGDVGQDQYEEIDVIEKGKNYGWNIMEASHCYKPKSGCNQNGLTPPIAEYSHDGGNCSVTGGYVYHGQAVQSLSGAYLYADYCSGTVWALPNAASTPGQPVQLLSKGPQISSWAQDAAGELYLLAFDGQIYRMEP